MNYRWRIATIFLVLLMIFSCSKKAFLDDDSMEECDYSYCNTQEPFIVFLEVKFTRSIEQRNPVIYLMLGRFEDQIYLDTVGTDTVPAYRNNVFIPVDVNHYYTVVGKYIRGSDTIYAIDGGYVSKSFYYMCDSVCWEVKGNKLNIKLKN